MRNFAQGGSTRSPRSVVHPEPGTPAENGSGSAPSAGQITIGT